MITPKNIIPVTTAKRELMRLLKEVQEGGESLVITKDGRAAGILMSTEEYEGLLETLEVLSDGDLIRSLKRAQVDFRRGRTHTHEQVFKE